MMVKSNSHMDTVTALFLNPKAPLWGILGNCVNAGAGFGKLSPAKHNTGARGGTVVAQMGVRTGISAVWLKMTLGGLSGSNSSTAVVGVRGVSVNLMLLLVGQHSADRLRG